VEENMTIAVFPVTPSFAAEIGDIDLSQPVEPSDYVAIDDAFAKYAVLIFPDQHLSQDRHLDFARHFGPLDVSIGVHRKDTPLRVREEITDVSNLDFKNEIWEKESRRRGFQLGARMWHTANSTTRCPKQ
jgi:alpha-ketoglutarate-dependent 2,4-dichlorophenoxyacetate dioxygenase